MSRDTLLRVLLVVLVVTSLAAPVVTAQEDATDSESDPVPSDPPAANESANESDDDDEGGFGNWVSDATPSVGNPMPSGSEVVKDIMEWVLEDMKEGIESGIDKLHFVLVGLPAPGDAEDPSSWVPPQNGAWPYVFSVFGLSSAISIVLLIFATQFVMGMNDLKRKREGMRKIGRAFLAGPVLGFPLVAICLHAGNAFAMALSPSGEEFLMDYGSVAELGFGFILGALLVKFKLIIIFIGLVILVMVYFSILFLAAVWPALWAMRVVPIPTLQSWGMLGLTGFGKLVIMRVIQAFLLRFTFEMPWGSIGNGSFFLAVIGMAVGLLIALVILPWIVLRKVTIASAVGLGMAGVSLDAVNNAPGQLRSGMSKARSRYQDMRSTQPPRNTGTVRSKPYSGSSQSKSATSSRTVGTFGSSKSSKGRSRSGKMRSKRNADRASRNRTPGNI